MNTRIHIERLILEGLPLHARDGDIVQAAIQTELERLFMARGVPAGTQRGIDPAAGEAPSFRLNASSQATDIGVRVGAGIYHAVAGPNRET